MDPLLTSLPVSGRGAHLGAARYWKPMVSLGLTFYKRRKNFLCEAVVKLRSDNRMKVLRKEDASTFSQSLVSKL